MTTTDTSLTGWIPYRLRWDDHTPQVEWCWRGDARFTEPFFDQSLTILHRTNRAANPPRPVRLTPLEALYELEPNRPSLAPSGFIFHISRCGSTVISRALAALPEHLVFSEPPFFDELLRIDRQLPDISDAERIRLLRAGLSAMAYPLAPEARMYVKLDCWHLLNTPLIRQAFPDVPAIFLYRDPVEVVVSLIREPSMTLLPETVPPEALNLRLEDSWLLPKPEYIARILGLFLQIGLNEQAYWELVNYTELPDILWGQLAKHFGYGASGIDHDDQQRMQASLKVHAKRPTEYFSDDRAAKHEKASPVIQAQCERWTAPLYEKLEQARTGQSSTT